MITLLDLTPLSIIRAILSLETVYVLTGVVLWIFAAMTFADRGNPRRFGSGCFWFTLGLIFIGGGLMPYWLTGLLVLLMVALDGAGRVARGRYDETTDADHLREADRLRNKIFIPVLMIPLVTFGVALAFRYSGLDPTQGALVGLGFGGIVAMAIGLLLTGGRARAMMDEGRRINDAMGAVNILPQLLGSLGVIFTASKVGDLIAHGGKQKENDENLDHELPRGVWIKTERM